MQWDKNVYLGLALVIDLSVMYTDNIPVILSVLHKLALKSSRTLPVWQISELSRWRGGGEIEVFVNNACSPEVLQFLPKSQQWSQLVLSSHWTGTRYAPKERKRSNLIDWPEIHLSSHQHSSHMQVSCSHMNIGIERKHRVWLFWTMFNMRLIQITWKQHHSM